MSSRSRDRDRDRGRGRGSRSPPRRRSSRRSPSGSRGRQRDASPSWSRERESRRARSRSRDRGNARPSDREAKPADAANGRVDGGADGRRKKSKWDDEPLTVGGVPVEAGAMPHLQPPAPMGGPMVKTLNVPVNCKGRIIGKGGVEINRMRAESQAHIVVKQEDGEEATVTLKGSRAQVEHAEVLIFELLKAGRPQERVVEVPRHCIGETIGHGGCNLQTMSERSGCKVKFVYATEIDPAAESGKQVCIIRGPPDKINMAEMLLNERVSEVQQEHIQKSMASRQKQNQDLPDYPQLVPPGFGLQAPLQEFPPPRHFDQPQGSIFEHVPFDPEAPVPPQPPLQQAPLGPQLMGAPGALASGRHNAVGNQGPKQWNNQWSNNW